MEREERVMPGVIGGVKTSKGHNALRIAPAEEGPWVHGRDASRAVGVASALVSDTQRDPFVAKVAEEYDVVRKSRANKGQSELAPIEEARANAFIIDPALKPPAPKQPGLHVYVDWDLNDLREHIDWTPFFRAWELAGVYPAILDDAIEIEEHTSELQSLMRHSYAVF